MDKAKPNQTGTLKISFDVIAAIAKAAAQEVNGVSGLAQASTGDMSGFPFRRFGKRPIDINMNDDIAEIDIHLCLAFGARIGDVCMNVQNSVKESVQTMTGIVVSKVNIYVDGIDFPESNTMA